MLSYHRIQKCFYKNRQTKSPQKYWLVCHSTRKIEFAKKILCDCIFIVVGFVCVCVCVCMYVIWIQLTVSWFVMCYKFKFYFIKGSWNLDVYSSESWEEILRNMSGWNWKARFCLLTSCFVRAMLKDRQRDTS